MFSALLTVSLLFVGTIGVILGWWLRGSCYGLVTKQDLKELEKLIMTQAELTAALDAKTTQLVKVAKEQSDRFDVLTAKVKELTDIINNGPGDVSPAVETALAGVTAALDSLDAAIPDAPEA